MTKRLLSTALALVLAIGIIPLANLRADAADSYYNVSKAIKYADKNWDNGKGLCADFVSKCLAAGGVPVQEDTVKALYDALLDKYGTAYKLKLTGGKKGSIKMADNKGKLSKGDPVFYKCNYCGDFEHVVLCNGESSDGYCIDYAHNNAHNGKKKTYTYNHCGGDSWTMYSIKMKVGPQLLGKKTSVGVPEITALANGADGVVIKWSKVKGADKYKIYRRVKDGKFECIGSPKKEKFTDKTAKNGVEYIYTVKAIDGKVSSQYYEGKALRCISAPALVSASNTANSVEFDWGKVKSADGYLVYRKTGSGSYEKIANIKGADKHSYVDKKIKDGVKYTYTVKAYDGNIKGAYVSAGKQIIFLKTPNLISAEAIEDGIAFSYSAFERAAGYRIYRKTDDATKWTLIAKVKGADLTEYIDTDVEEGVSYSYTVKSFNGSSVSHYNKKGISAIYTAPAEVETEAPEIQ